MVAFSAKIKFSIMMIASFVIVLGFFPVEYIYFSILQKELIFFFTRISCRKFDTSVLKKSL